MVTEEKDARLRLKKKKNGAKHWQCEEEAQNVEEKPWKNEELRSEEEALQRLKECQIGRSAKSVLSKFRSRM